LNKNSQTRVLIVDDSAFMRTALARMVASDSELLVVGTASNGVEALLKVKSLDPDVVTLDVQMPGLDGVQTLRRIMAEAPRPVIMVSSATSKGAEITFNALAAGAFDYIPKELSSASLDILHIRAQLLEKLKSAGESRARGDGAKPLRKPPLSVGLPAWKAADHPVALVALGISTGGPNALQEILPSLPKDLGVAILVVQHTPLGFTGPFASRLNRLCAVSVCEARQGEEVKPGVIYIAPAGLHLTVERPTQLRTVISLSGQLQDRPHIPSVDVMMRSVAFSFHSLAMGVIMTGMGVDGAQGMSAIHRAGGFTVGQDEASCAVYGMPRVCADMGILDRIVPLSGIVQEILGATRYRKVSAS